MSHTQTFDLLYTALCHLIIKFLVFKIFQKKKKKKKGGMRSNRVTTTKLTHVKRINKYLLLRPHISVEYNNISKSISNSRQSYLESTGFEVYIVDL